MTQPFTKDGVALITGGASGVGLALAKKCLQGGMRVIVADKNASSLDIVKQEHDGITVFQADVGQKEDWDALKSIVERDFNGEFCPRV
jgi:short-subunit dehydrogenase involved in D-alanine esterification of teichoic acids